MNTKTTERLPALTAAMLVVLVAATCTIPLRYEGQANSTASGDVISAPFAAKLAECRSVTSEQKDALAECRKVWAKKRRQFLGQGPSTLLNGGNPGAGFSLFVWPKDESRLPSGDPPAQQTGQE